MVGIETPRSGKSRTATYLTWAKAGRYLRHPVRLKPDATSVKLPDATRAGRHAGHSRLPIIGRDERDRVIVGERPLKEIGPREAVHIAADRQAEEIENRRRDVDHRRAFLLAASRDRSAVGQQEAVRRGFVRAA